MKKLCLILLCASTAAYTMERLSDDEIRRKMKQLEAQMAQTQNQIRQQQLKKAHLERELAQARLAQQEREIARVQEQMRRTLMEKEQLEQQLATKVAREALRKKIKGQKGPMPMRRIGMQGSSPLGQTSAVTDSDSE